MINKSKGHTHFWILRCRLYESMKTFIGMRFVFISEILWPDTDKLSDEEMITISKILNGEET